MSVDFKYKDFVNQLRFQVVKNCPDFTEWNWDDGEKYTRDVFYFHTIKYGEICHENPLIDVESCETITQVIAEWTFHKTIDLIAGQIPLDFHKLILEHINKKIYEYFNRPDVNEITKGAYFTDKVLNDIQKLVKDTYRSELAGIYSDKGIDKDTYTNALTYSHFDDFNDTLSCGENGEFDPYEKKTDKVVARRIIKDAFEGHLNDYLRMAGYKLYLLLFFSLLLYILGLYRHDNISIILGTFYLLACWGYILKSYMSMRVDELQEKVDDYKNETEDWKIYRNPNELYKRLGVDVISIQVGQKLINYFDPENGLDLISYASQLRKSLTDELGYIIPNIRFMDDINLKGYEVCMYVRGALRDKFVLNPSKEDVREVIFNNTRNCCIKYVNEILTKTDVIKLMELVIAEDPTLVNDLIPAEISAIDLRRILVNLLREEVSVKDITKIFERLAELVKQNKNPYILTERLRIDFGAEICNSLAIDKKGEKILYLADLSSQTEKVLLNRLQNSEFGSVLNLSADEYTKLFNAIDTNFGKMKKVSPDNIVIITQASLRYPLFKILSSHHPFIKVISYAELPDDLPIKIEHVCEI